MSELVVDDAGSPTKAASAHRSLLLADLARIVAEERDGAIAVTGPGAFAGQLYMQDPESASLYNMELAYATSMALGIAVELPGERVIAVEGDGSMLAALGVLATIARYRPPNLTTVIIVNGIYGTGDNSVRTQTGIGADLGRAALALGWPEEQVVDVRDPAELRQVLIRARESSGPWLVQAFVDPASYARSAGRPRPGVDVAESGVLLRRELQRRRGR